LRNEFQPIRSTGGVSPDEIPADDLKLERGRRFLIRIIDLTPQNL
jgi:hypothetical protein